MACSNLAHVIAASDASEKKRIVERRGAHVGIVTAYNDMLSAHQPFARFPPRIKIALHEVGATAQVAAGVPAMCDGVTQGREGMELSLFSRDVIALSTAIGLSHDVFDATLCLGVCDKIVPGLLIGALSFGHLPTVFVPAGPMPSGLPNREKAAVRQRYAAGEVGRAELLEAESAAYHAPGTCTFYGTANSNQMFLEVMGLMIPGGAFANPGTPLRDALTVAAAQRVAQITASGDQYTPLGEVVDERCILNAAVGLLATGGSTNHTIHLPAIARAAGILLDWDDLDELSSVIPLLARVYPNGSADVNDFDAAGGLPFVIGELLAAGLLHADVKTIADGGLEAYSRPARLENGALTWGERIRESAARDIVRPVDEPFEQHSGMRLVRGNLGRAIVKTSAIRPELRRVEAPAIVFDEQSEFAEAFAAGKLERDFVAVLRFQGPRANGMPELHQMMPPLGLLQDRGHRVALVTDGRLSGASGKVPAAIHVCPEALADGPLSLVRTGDRIVLDPEQGLLEACVEAEEWKQRVAAVPALGAHHSGLGRELFGGFRALVTSAEQGASSLGKAVPA
jgi:phosphogluconate dehydratase